MAYLSQMALEELQARNAGDANRMMVRSLDHGSGPTDTVVFKDGRLYVQTSTTPFLFLAPIRAGGTLGPVERQLRVAID